MIRSYRKVRDDLSQAAYELAVLRATRPLTARIASRVAMRIEIIEGCRDELKKMFHEDAANTVVREITNAYERTAL
jgi:hypothetical protein